MDWWPFSGLMTFYLIGIAFCLLYVWALASVEMGKQKQRRFRESAEYQEWRDRMDGRR